MNPARILVVDDDENLRWVLKTQLEDMGYSVSTAIDGEQALAAIERELPALILTDLKMPGLSGLELLDRIRADYPEMPVVIITAFATIQNAVQAMRAGAYDYLTKPIDYDELALVVTPRARTFPADCRSAQPPGEPRPEIWVREYHRTLGGSALFARYCRARGTEQLDDLDSCGDWYRQGTPGSSNSLE